MSKKKTSKKLATTENEKSSANTEPIRPIPEALPEELLPLYDWWHATGKQMAVIAAVAVVVIGLGILYRQHLAAKGRLASERLLAANSAEDLETLVSQYGDTKAGLLAQIRLAKAYYDDGRYEDALARYDALARKSSHPFAAIVVLGRAHVLEAKGDIREAQAAFAAFRNEHPDHFLTPQAFMGEARCLALQGDKTAAAELLDVLIAAKTDTPWEDVAVNLKEIVARYEKRAPVSLFDQADFFADTMAQPVPAPPVRANAEQPTNALPPATVEE